MTVTGFGGDIDFGLGGYGSTAYGVDNTATSAAFTTVAAQLLWGRRVAASTASISFVDQTANLRVARRLPAAATSIAFIAIDAGVRATRRLPAAATSIAFTGQTVILSTALRVTLTGLELELDQAGLALDTAYTVQLMGQVAVFLTQGDLAPWGWVIDLPGDGNWQDIAEPGRAWVEVVEPSVRTWTVN